MNSFKPKVEPLEGRDVPAVINLVVNTEMDLPDANIGDGIAQTAGGWVSLRSVIQEVNASGNAADTYLVEYANVLGQQFQDSTGLIVTPTPQTEMVIPLGSHLPTIPAGRDYRILGSTTRRVTLTRDVNVPAAVKFRFLDVAGGQLEVNGLRLVNADNRTGNGGAISNTAGGTLNVVNCFFRDNKADRGGAIYNTAVLNVRGGAPGATSRFEHNAALQFGGAIHTESVAGVVAPPPTVSVEDTYFTDNLSGNIAQWLGTQPGGAIARRSGSLTVLRCDFTSNHGREGGAIYAQGVNTATPLLTVTDTTFAGNSNQGPGLGPVRGGAVCIIDLNALFTGCVFDTNATAGEGGAIFQENGLLNLDACTFMFNTAAGPFGSNDVANDVPPGAPLTVHQSNGSNAVVTAV